VQLLLVQPLRNQKPNRLPSLSHLPGPLLPGTCLVCNLY
jgi:hypothetical protein